MYHKVKRKQMTKRDRTITSEEPALTIAQVQKALQVSRLTVLRRIGNGELDAFKVGRQWRIKPAALERLSDRKARVA